jgi:hypothetical protein
LGPQIKRVSVKVNDFEKIKIFIFLGVEVFLDVALRI